MGPKNNAKVSFAIVRRSMFIPSHHRLRLSEGISALGCNDKH